MSRNSAWKPIPTFPRADLPSNWPLVQLPGRSRPGFFIAERALRRVPPAGVFSGTEKTRRGTPGLLRSENTRVAQDCGPARACHLRGTAPATRRAGTWRIEILEFFGDVTVRRQMPAA